MVRHGFSFDVRHTPTGEEEEMEEEAVATLTQARHDVDSPASRDGGMALALR